MSDVVVTFNEFAKAGGEEGLKAAIVTTMVRIRNGAVVKAAGPDTGRGKNSFMWRKGWGSDVFNFPQEGGFNEYGSGEHAVVKIEKPNGMEGVVGTALGYMIYQEFGTRFMPAQPALRPAADEVRGANASEIAKKWGNEAMHREFQQRKTTRSRR